MWYLSTSFSAKTMSNYIIDKEKCVEIIELNVKPITWPENTNMCSPKAYLLGSKNKRMKETLWGKRKQHKGWLGKSVLQFLKCTSKTVNYLFVYVWVNNTSTTSHHTYQICGGLSGRPHTWSWRHHGNESAAWSCHPSWTYDLHLHADAERERKNTINHFHIFFGLNSWVIGIKIKNKMCKNK